MNDYSQFFKRPESFIKECNIDENESTISAEFANRTNNTKFIYPLEKKTVIKLHDKLTKQYQKLVENKYLFFKSKKRTANKARKILFSSFTIFAGITFGMAQFGLLGLEMIAVLASLISLLGLTYNEIMRHHEEKAFDIYEEYFEKNKVLKDVAEKEVNILANIRNESTINALKEQNSLYKQGLIDNVFNTFFMDKASLEDLKRILTNLRIYEGLNEEVTMDKSLYCKKRTLKRNR